MKKLKRKNGFTLMEVLAVIGMIAVVSAIAIPSVFSIRSSLNEQQENNYARDIYLAVQDELASRRIDGSIVNLSKENYDSVFYASESDERILCDEVKEILVLDPEMRAMLMENDVKKEYTYLSGVGRDFLLPILPDGKIDSTIFSDSIRVSVIFNQMSGDVFYVRYGEKGRYGGEVVNQADKLKLDEEVIKPVVEVIQDEECFVRVTVKVPNDMRSQDGCIKFCNGLSYVITMNDDYKYQYPDPENEKNADTFTSTYHSDSCELIWSIDSMIEGLHFEDKFKDPDNSKPPILSGEDITVSVQCSYTGEGKKVDIDQNAVELTFNPLFHSVEEKDGKYTVEIANGRELQNLNHIDDSFVGKVGKVFLSDNIKWEKTVSYYSDWFWTNIDKIKESTNQKTVSNSKLFLDYQSMWYQFQPLEGKLFAEDASNKPVFDGNNKKIVTLHVRPVLDGESHSADKRSGMFRSLYSEVKNLNFVDPVVMGTDDTGVLAGYAEGATVSGCSVTVSKPNLQLIEAINLSSVFYGATLVDPDAYNKSVGLLIGHADGCTLSDINIKIQYETEGETADIFVPVTSSHFGLIAGTAENCTVSKGEKGNIIFAGIRGGNTCHSDDRKNLEGAAGAAFGYVSGGNVSDVSVDGTISGVTAGSLGGIVGKAENAEIENCTFRGTIDGGLADSLGGLIGTAQANAEITSSSVTGKLTDISANCFGGAVGSTYEGTFSDITVDTDAKMSVNSVWYVGETGDNKLESNYGKFNCPSGLGYAGKFVGFISSGDFSDCSALCSASGRRDDDHVYSNMQFVGAVRCSEHTRQIAEGLYQIKDEGKTKKYESPVQVKCLSATEYEKADDSSVTFVPRSNPTYYEYDGISLDNCIYKDNSAKTMKQLIGNDKTYYYYDLSNESTDIKIATENKSLKNGDRYLPMRAVEIDTDGDGKTDSVDYDVMICEKVTIPKGELQSRWKNGEFYIVHCGTNTGVVMYDSEEDSEKNNNSYYFSTKDDYYYKPLGASHDNDEYPYEASHKYDKIDDKYDVYKYNIRIVRLQRDFGIDYSNLTEEEYKELEKYSCRWQAHNESGTTGNLIYDGFGWDNAYVYLSCDDAYLKSQKNLLVLPYSDDLARWYDSGTCRSTNSGFFLSAEVNNGSLLIYRNKKISITDQKASFNFDENGTSLKVSTDLSKLSTFSSGVSFISYEKMEPIYKISYASDATFQTYSLMSEQVN